MRIVSFILGGIVACVVWLAARRFVPRSAPSEWVELEFFRGVTAKGLAREVRWLGRTWCAFSELKRDGAFKPERRLAERKLFAYEPLTEGEARRRVLGEPWRTPCDVFEMESAI